jgi:hypothetical protein
MANGDEGEPGEASDLDFDCPQCGTSLTAGTMKCPNCKLELDWETGFECPQCGAVIEEDSAECPMCGLVFMATEEAEEEPAPEPEEAPPEGVIEEPEGLGELREEPSPEVLAGELPSEVPEEMAEERPEEAPAEEEPEEAPEEPIYEEVPEEAPEELVSEVEPEEAPEELPEIDILEMLERSDEISIGKGDQGPPEGLVNGRGFINGKGLTRRKGMADQRGLVNGTGLTYDTGLVDSGGLTNGRGLTKPDGMVNGRGLVNGNGLVNGLGLINGLGLTNGNGLTNGKGLTNGQGLTNGEGITNGKGITSDEGITNGKGLDQLEMRAPRIPPRRKRKTPVLIAAFFTFLLIVLALVWWSIPVKEEHIVIDGEFEDWSDAYLFTDRDLGQQPVGDPDVDIKEWAIDASDEDLSLLVKVAGSMLSGKNGGVDTIHAFIDADRSATSGYAVRGIGADYLIEVTGWDGEVHSAALREWTGGAHSGDLARFEARGGVSAAAADDSLELKVWTESVGMAGTDDLVRVLVRTADGSGHVDWSSAAANQRGPALEVIQEMDGLWLNLSAYAQRADVEVSFIEVTYEGQGAEGRASTGIQGATRITEGMTSRLRFDPPIVIEEGTAFEFNIDSDLTAGIAGRPVVASSDGVIVAGDAEAYVAPPLDWTAVARVALPADDDIRIDGNFEDWYNLGKDIEVDDQRDVEDREGKSAINPNIDILGTNAVLTPLTTPTHVSCYVRTSGEVLGGLIVQTPIRPGPPGPAGPPGPLVEHLYLEDRTLIYIDADPATGIRVSPDVRADYYIDIWGKFGQVLGSRLLSLEDGRWQEATGVNVPVGLDRDELEVKVAMGGVVDIDPSGEFKTFFITTDWSGNRDEAESTGRAVEGSRIYASETSVAPESVRRGETNVPILRIDLENREALPVEVIEVYAALLGTIPPEDLVAVRLWQADRGVEGFMEADSVEVSAGSSWEGLDVLVGLHRPLVVGPYGAVSLFLTVDISASATTLNWFDLWVLNVEGLVTWSEIILEDVHDSNKLVRVWNSTGGRHDVTNLAINEFYPNPASGGQEWVELINPTTGNINLDDYEIRVKPKGQKIETTIHTFGSSDNIAKDNGIAVWNTGTNEIPAAGTIYLYDALGGQVDAIRYNTIPSQNSMARFRDAQGDPQDNLHLYTTDSPTKGTQNEIPEFTDIVFPAVGTLVLFTIVRRRIRPGRTGD